jgi:hypothetical protein
MLESTLIESVWDACNGMYRGRVKEQLAQYDTDTYIVWCVSQEL